MEEPTGYSDYREQLDKYQEQANRTNSSNVWWCFVVKNGHYVNIGCQPTESECYQMYCEQGEGRAYEICGFPTRNVAEAHRMFKKYLLEKKHVGLDSATSLISRKPAEEQKKKERGFLDSWKGVS